MNFNWNSLFRGGMYFKWNSQFISEGVCISDRTANLFQRVYVFQIEQPVSMVNIVLSNGADGIVPWVDDMN